MRIYIHFILLLISYSCATLNKEECASTNWSIMAKEDVQHERESRLTKYIKDCSEHGIKVDSNAYQKSWAMALKEHCTFGTGLKTGEQGNDHYQECKAFEEYYHGHSQGLSKYCTFNRGKERGEEDRSSEHLCNSISAYAHGYQVGQQRFEKKKEDEEHKQAIEEALERLNECSSDSDCDDDECYSNRCSESGNECSSDFDCRGECRQSSEYVHEVGEYLTARKCEY